jgi:uncharacterized membrane protein YcaP (DUF421 family)
MKKLDYSVDDVKQQLRQLGWFYIDKVQTAILEPYGGLSVPPKSDYRPFTRKDFGSPYPMKHYPVELIIEGKLLEGSLQERKYQRNG